MLRLHLWVCDSVKNLGCYQEFLRVFSKGTALTSMHICPRKTTKGSETAQRCYRSEGVERERDFVVSPRFRFSCGRKQKERGSLYARPVLPLFVSFSRRRSSTRTCTGNPAMGQWSFISRASDTRASRSPLAHPPKCARILHVHAYTSHHFSLHGGWVEVTRTAPAGFLKDKSVTRLAGNCSLSLRLQIYIHTRVLSDKRERKKKRKI